MPDYYSYPRHEIVPHVPAGTKRLLDVGCGSGATISMLKERFPEMKTYGVELMPDQAQRARAAGHEVWQGKVEDCPFEEFVGVGSMDVITCLDVLEHLVDPWSAVERLSTLLKPGGKLIVSLPNIRHWKFIAKLIIRGDFIYRDEGLLDRTHLRFFVLKTGIELATKGGLMYRTHDPVYWYHGLAYARMSKYTRKYTDNFCAVQWLIISEKS